MKKIIKSLVVYLIIYTPIYNACSQTAGDFRSKSGQLNKEWALASTWERYNGSNWVAAANAPDNTNGQITIVNNSSVNIEASITLNEVLVENNATLRLKNSAILTINNTPGGPAVPDIEVNGSFIINGGYSIEGAGILVVRATGNLNIMTNILFKADMRNEGTLNWEVGATNITLYDDTIFRNEGTMNIYSDGAMVDDINLGDFRNNGILNKYSSTSCSINVKNNLNNGTINVLEGSLSFGTTFNPDMGIFENNSIFSISAGAFFKNEMEMNLNTGSLITGDGYFFNNNGTIHLNTNLTIPSNTNFQNQGVFDGAGNLIINSDYVCSGGPRFDGPGTLTINGKFDWLTGGSSGNREMIVTATGIMNFNDTPPYIPETFIQCNITNNGLITWAGSNTLFPEVKSISFLEDKTLTNNGIININVIEANDRFELEEEFGNNATLINNGLIRKVGEGMARISLNNFTNAVGGIVRIANGTLSNNLNFNNLGNLDLQSTSVSFTNGAYGTYHINKVDDIPIQGQLNNQGNLILNINITLGANQYFSNATGIVSGVGNFSVGQNYPYQPFTLDGDYTGTGTLTIPVNITWTAGRLARNLTINPNKTMTINSLTNILAATLTNNGTINWVQGNVTIETAKTLINNGIADVSISGVNRNLEGLGTFDNYGTLKRSHPDSVNFKLSNFINRPTGTISGAGIFKFNNTTFTNNGKISPGSSPGILKLHDGQPLSATSILEIEMFSGAAAGIGYDQLSRSTSLTLAGTLNVIETGSVPDGVYPIINIISGIISGSFATVNLPSGYTLQVNSKTVTVTKISQPLPITLISFTGKSTENGNLLQWKTVNETNFSHFEVEKSPEASVALAPDGGFSNGKFERIGIVESGFGSSEKKSYEFIDQQTSSPIGGWGAAFYRLKLIDLDGKFTYSKIIFIENEALTPPSGGWGAAYPNPFINQISIDNSENKELKISLIDMTGREIIKSPISNQNRIDLNTEKVETGLYFLQIKEGEKSKIQKVIKQ